MSNHENSFSNSYVPSVCAPAKNSNSSFALENEHSFGSVQPIQTQFSSSTSNASKRQAQWIASLDGSTPDVSESKKSIPYVVYEHPRSQDQESRNENSSVDNSGDVSIPLSYSMNQPLNLKGIVLRALKPDSSNKSQGSS